MEKSCILHTVFVSCPFHSKFMNFFPPRDLTNLTLNILTLPLFTKRSVTDRQLCPDSGTKSTGTHFKQWMGCWLQLCSHLSLPNTHAPNWMLLLVSVFILLDPLFPPATSCRPSWRRTFTSCWRPKSWAMTTSVTFSTRSCEASSTSTRPTCYTATWNRPTC